MKLLVFALFVAVAFAQEGEPPAAQEPETEPNLTLEEQTRYLENLEKRLQRTGTKAEKMKAEGVKNIQKLKELIEANQCGVLDGIEAPTIPEAAAEAASEPVPAPELTEQQASAAIRELLAWMAEIENNMAKMVHVGLTNIDKLDRFIMIAGDNICPQASEEAEDDSDR